MDKWDYLETKFSKSQYEDGDFDIEVLYDGIAEAYEDGVEVGKKETIERAMKWLYAYYPTIERCRSAEDAWKYFEKAMLEEE